MGSNSEYSARRENFFWGCLTRMGQTTRVVFMSIFKRKKEPSNHDFLGELEGLNLYVSSRIEQGDIDLDDWLYRTRDATAELLDILGPKPVVPSKNK